MKLLQIILVPEVREAAKASLLAQHKLPEGEFLGPEFAPAEGVTVRVEYEAGGVRVRVLASHPTDGNSTVSYFYPWHVVQRVKEIS